MNLKINLLAFSLFAATAANAKEVPIRIFPRSYGYFTKGDSEKRTVIYNHAYGEYGWKNNENIELSAYKYLLLEIEPTDSQMEVFVLYDGCDKGFCIGKIEKGDTKTACKFSGIRKVSAIYLVKSKPGLVKIIRFSLVDELNE